MKAVIKLDVPEWQIGQDVMVYFPDTMTKKGKCELLKEKEEVIPVIVRMERSKYYHEYVCPVCKNDLFYDQNYCSECGRPVHWD